MPREFWSFQERENYTNLYILDEIASKESWWVDTVTPQNFRRQLFGVNGELHIWINSPGGDAFAGAAIYDMIREYSRSGRGKTVAMISMAASAASIIAMACDEIRISVLGTIMIHEPWSQTAGPAREHIATAQILENIRTGQINAYAQRTGQSPEKILELMNGGDGNGTYMNANMAIELGFADSIIDGEEGGDAKRFASSLRDMRIQSAMRNAADLLTAAAAVVQPKSEGEGENQKPAENTVKIDARMELLRTVAKSY